MIENKFQQIAQEKGIRTAYQFQKLSGFAPAMAAHLYKGDWTRIDIKTLNTVCNLFKCTPNDIFVFTPDKEDQ
ncbi:MAG: helix-turn-helix transcriptional regulator [Pyrinomonadaceae bacterium]|nr:helix-turn-helix transcriptional regulator [Pyrinomonadaceae bacterium]